ncbi:MAG: F0F1 ATP synthase subunit gamma [Alphaproteobacteria bacterium]|nr:F0F1 ATP synthase subunit gamma [Alphaproteobacteria bacterium]
MSSLKELRNRIASVQATQKITRAMQMVAASKLRRAEEKAAAARPYAAHIYNILAHFAAEMGGRADAPPLLVGRGEDKAHLLIMATAERGLCGGFNSSIARLVRSHALQLKAQNKQVKILSIGRKGADIVRRDFANDMIEPISLQNVKNIGFTQAQTIAKQVLTLFDENTFDVCTLYYAEFVNVLTQRPLARQIIPVPIENIENDKQEFELSPIDLNGAVYEHEPTQADILAKLLPHNIAVQLLCAFLENAASEQGARMSAMDSATRNAGEMIDKLSITYNRTRQAQITKELIEIISGAEDL